MSTATRPRPDDHECLSPIEEIIGLLDGAERRSFWAQIHPALMEVTTALNHGEEPTQGSIHQISGLFEHWSAYVAFKTHPDFVVHQAEADRLADDPAALEDTITVEDLFGLARS